MRLHVLGFPFSETTRRFEHCAFTARTRVFAQMMSEHGYEVILYAGQNNEAKVTEHVPLTNPDEQRSWWPEYVPERDVFNDFDPSGFGWMAFNARGINAIRERSEPGDVLCITMGGSQRSVAEALPDLFHVETGIGYEGIWAPYRVFESWAWRNYLTGRSERSDDVRFYDEVIPRAYEVADFPTGTGDGGFVLYIGRLIRRKGPHVAAMAAQRADVPLYVAGQGVAEHGPGRVVCDDGTELEGDVTYLGVLGPQARAEVMGKAMAVLVPTLYLEPFGGVSVEAQLCGTPTICSNWGGLVENVKQNRTGFLCNTLADFTDAITWAQKLDRDAIRSHAQAVWGTDTIAQRFDAYFTRLQTLQGDGWYA